MSISTRRGLWIGLLVALLVPAASRPQAPKKDFILYGGDVVTLDDQGSVAEAVWVREGKIEAVGKREEVLRQAPKTAERIDLQGHAVLPGFVEPHLHLDVLALTSFFTDLNPCLPARYETRKRCPLSILEALKDLKDSKISRGPWLAGSGIDPSLMPLDENGKPSTLFLANPAFYIEHYVSATRPVIILDKSEHLAYVNRQAFVAAGICENADNCSKATAKKPEPPPPGKWETDKNGFFTGQLVEQQAFTDFAKAMPEPKPQEIAVRAEAGAREFARSGVTTMVNGGTGDGDSIVRFFRNLASRSRAHPLLRYRMLLPWNGVPRDFTKPLPWDEKDGGLFGVTGIKLWADGSLQECTANLLNPYAKDGHCGSAKTGMVDFNMKQVIASLAPFWKAGWPIQIHVNGDAATLTILDALAALQLEARNDSPITLLHFTLDGNPATGEDIVQQVANLRAGRFVYQEKPVPPVDVHVSHLIGHVAYWGGALEGILDGVHGPGHPDETGRAARIDATRRDLELGVPFSLHSDNPVTPAHPLWYVEQAVTRNTWFYPRLKDTERHPMPGGQNVTIEQALRAVTLEPAIQHGLGRYIGSIEKGKAADLVILDKNPLKQPSDEIHRIRVLSTFVGGYRHDWSRQ